jgi:hypothetical protein
VINTIIVLQKIIVQEDLGSAAKVSNALDVI